MTTNTLFDALLAPHRARKTPFLHLSEPGSPAEVSFEDFLAQAARLAHVLVASGVTPGDRVLVQAPKRSEMLALYAAAIQAGAVFLPLNTAYRLDEVSYFIADAAPKLVVCTSDMADALRPLAEAEGGTVLTLNADGSGTLAERMQGQPDSFDTVPRGPDDLAALLYTSGTTGRSKGAMLTHDNLLSNTRALVDLWRITSDDRLIHALPIFHTHGLFVAMNTFLLAGGQVRFLNGFDLDAILDAMPESTVLMGVPTFYTRLLGDARLTAERAANMRLFISGSAPLLAETHTAFSARTGHQILERYGMTETNMTTSNPYEGARKPGTVGHPLPGVEIRLTDPESGAPVPQGSVGMVEVRGPNVFKGYWQMPEKTAEEMREDGFFITGDLGQLDAEGYLSIVGRQKDLIITGGLNVYPKEIEDVLNAVPGVAESAVYGVPDPDFGERIIADVVPRPDAQVTEDALQAAAATLARFKHPKVYRIVEALPRNTMGKVQKNVLRTSYKG
ncbi:malonate--CoA ligase [Oceanibium sediminis]|uniref:malonate--CoA ligase n=1 Tax=Oceanibium sediminis TaxID=2026339 RepID=UPI000DD4E6A1|nr:malonyl-CoA synthase [Oceanibium sediminis]